MSVMSLTRPPLPPFTFETAVQKVRRAEDAWNTCNPEQVSLANTVDSYWRNRAEFIQGPRQSWQSDRWRNRYIQSWRTELGGWFSLPGTSPATP